MAETSKRKSNDKFLFVGDEEDGEISDDDEIDEKEAKKRRDTQFIQEWAEKVGQQKQQVQDEIKTDMEIGSDSEEEESKIDVKPIAMTITFRDERFARKHRGVIETQMVMKYGPELVDSNTSCIFVSPVQSSTEISLSLAVPLGAMTVTFHDEAFCAENYQYVADFCKELFGSSKVTCDKWVIEVVENDLLDFDVDTSRFGPGVNMMYSKPSEGVIADNKSSNFRGRPAADCFNCGGAHSLHQCRERKNYQLINENREKFRQRKMKGNGRYHVEVDKLSGLSPGSMSPVLRDALGLRSTQLPRHIYRMRRFGYPPGWLEEARVAHSGVTVYGSGGAVPEEGDEEGQVFEEGEKDRYDIKKIIEFCGFNVAPPEDTEMEHELHDCPPLSAEQDVSDMIRRLAPNAYQAYKKRRARNEAALTASSADPCENENDSCINREAVTPSEGCDVNISTPKPAEKSGNPSARNSDIVNGSLLGTRSDSVSTPEPALRPVAVNLGTPVLPSASPFAALPERDKFGVNISDVINFENLPNSTGTYEKVVGSIAKIRQFVAQNSQDEAT